MCVWPGKRERQSEPAKQCSKRQTHAHNIRRSSCGVCATVCLGANAFDGEKERHTDERPKRHSTNM